MTEEIKNIEETKAEVAEVKSAAPVKLEGDGVGIYGSSDSFKLAWQMAQGLANSTIIPQNFQKNPSNCLVALEQAQRLQMSPFLVMQNLYVIQGKPSWSSSFLIAMINASGNFDIELQFEETTDKNGNPESCMCWTEKDGRRINGLKVTMDMANNEGWTKKSGTKWATLPQLMLRYRAASFFARLNCPELTLGMYTKEEFDDNDMTDKPKSSKKASLNDLLKDEAEPDEIIVDAEVIDG